MQRGGADPEGKMLVWLRLLANRVAGRAVGSGEGETTPKRKAALRNPEPPVDQIDELMRIVAEATDKKFPATASRQPNRSQHDSSRRKGPSRR